MIYQNNSWASPGFRFGGGDIQQIITQQKLKTF